MRVFVPENAKTIPEEAEKVFTGELFEVYQWPQEMFDDLEYLKGLPALHNYSD